MECFTAQNQFRAVKTRFLPGTSLFLPAGDVGGEIKCMTMRNSILMIVSKVLGQGADLFLSENTSLCQV